MKSRSLIIIVLYGVLAGYVAVVCIASILETTPFSNRFTDIAPILLTLLFLVLPIAGLILFLLNRKCRQEHSKSQRVFIHTARAAIVVGWLFSCVPVGFIIIMLRLWPVSLSDGPDTEYAHEGFAKTTGFKPSSSVSKIYYRSVGWMTDGNDYLRFQVASPDVVQRIVTDKKMTRQSEWEMMKSSPQFPRWWSKKKGKKDLECYSQKDRKYGPWHYLWYDPETGIVWYGEFDF